MTKRSFTPADAVLVAIDMAKNRQEVLIERPDRGSQYVWIRYSDTANAWPKQASSPRSAASANSYDNALAETINGLYKAELSIGADPGARSRLSNTPHSNRAPGSTNTVCSSPSATSRPPKLRSDTMP